MDLVIQCSNPEISQLLELASFLDPHFKLGYVSDRDSTSKEVKEQMCAAGNYVPDGGGGLSSASDDSASQKET